MHGPNLAKLILVVASVLLLEGAAEAVEAPPKQSVAEARRALLDDRPVAAIGALEVALADPSLRSPADKQTVLGLLRQSYEAAADQAEAAGRPLEGESYRENARILRRRTGTIGGSSAPAPAPAPATAPGPRPVAPESTAPAVVEAAPPVVEGPADAPLALPEMTNQPTTTPVDPSGGNPGGSARSTARPDPLDRPSGLDGPAKAPQAPSEPTGPGLAEADAAFRSKKYAEAGRIYEALARENQLPVDRREHWAYCRSSIVARKIAAKPKTEAEWASIDAEIEQIRALAPNNWLGDYLRNRASARPSAKKLAQGGSTVVRAASPEEAPPLASRAARSAPAPADNLAAMANPPARAGMPGNGWQRRESANFRVFHVDPKMAEKVVQIAEATRRDQTKRWSGSLPPAPWQPKCEIYLYPTAAQYAQMTGQPDDSPGFSTMGMNQGEIISRRVNVRTDHEGLLGAVLPHEVTHVILADFFREQQIPRWADEGMAVLTEPVAEQKRRAADLVEPLGKNLLFPIETLMKMDYPDNRYWSLYYAQSVSLTRFLVEQGTPAQLVEFLQGSQANGFEAELRRVYKIDGFNDLQARWVVYARANLEGNATAPTATASNTTRGDARTR